MLALLHLAPEGLTLASPMTRSSNMQSSRAHTVHMQADEATRDGEPDIRYDANAGWTREENIKEMKGKHTMSGDFEATDTPDFFDDSEYSQKAAKIDYEEGMMGSQHKPGQSGTHNPGVEGALEVNPDIYVPEEEVIEIENSDFVHSGMTDLDFDMFTIQVQHVELCTVLHHALHRLSSALARSRSKSSHPGAV